MDVVHRFRQENGRQLSVLVVRFPGAMRAIASAPHGGGLGPRRWIINAQVPSSYGRRDPDRHLGKLGVSLGLPGRGVGMMTAVELESARQVEDGGVEVLATVGLGQPLRAAAPLEEVPARTALVGTINVVAVVPAPLSDAALVNAIATATEAKVQALADMGLDGTGTATDAVCILCPEEGRRQAFGGPRSYWGSRLARAVHRAILS